MVRRKITTTTKGICRFGERRGEQGVGKFMCEANGARANAADSRWRTQKSLPPFASASAKAHKTQLFHLRFVRLRHHHVHIRANSYRVEVEWDARASFDRST
jgi:hypothetical protein